MSVECHGDHKTATKAVASVCPTSIYRILNKVHKLLGTFNKFNNDIYINMNVKKSQSIIFNLFKKYLLHSSIVNKF